MSQVKKVGWRAWVTLTASIARGRPFPSSPTHPPGEHLESVEASEMGAALLPAGKECNARLPRPS